MDIVATRPHTLRTKGDAVALALVLSEQNNGCGERNSVDLVQAQEIYDFICRNVDLPIAEVDGQSAFLSQVGQYFKQVTENECREIY